MNSNRTSTLAVGEVPPLPFQSSRHWRYTDPTGLECLRRAIAALEKVDITRICVTAGASMALTVLALRFPTRQFVIPLPWYPGYPAVLRTARTNFVSYRILQNDGVFVPDMGQLEEHISKAPSAIIWNFPHNPTGAMPDAESIRLLAQMADKYDSWVISDEVYRPLVYDQDNSHLWPESLVNPDRLYRVRSFSKCWSLAGERVGWVVTPTRELEHFRDCHWRLAMSVSVSSQLSALGALEATNIQQTIEDLRTRRDLVVSKTQSSEFIHLYSPSGGVFLWMRLHLPRQRLEDGVIMGRILGKLRLDVPTGKMFGVDGCFLRIPFAEPTAALKGISSLDCVLGRLAGKQ